MNPIHAGTQGGPSALQVSFSLMKSRLKDEYQSPLPPAPIDQCPDEKGIRPEHLTMSQSHVPSALCPIANSLLLSRIV